MMNSIKSGLSFFFLFITFINFGQDKSDLGLFITTSRDNRVFLEYRKQFAEKSHFRLGISYGNYSSNFFEQGKIIEASDSLVREEKFYTSSQLANLRVGVERQIKSSIFSWGVNALIGYRNEKNAYYDRLSILSPDSIWESPSYFTNPFQNPSATRVIRKYISPGLQLTININIPISDMFELNMFIANTYWLDIFVQETGKIGDPIYFNERVANTFNSDSSFGLGIRYKFTKKDV